MPKTYTVKEVADLLGFSTNSIYTFIKENRIDAVKVGKGRFRISEEELKKLLRVTSLEIPKENQPPHITLLKNIQKSRLEELYIPSFFDWFIGIAAIIFGTSIILYVSAVDNPMYRAVLDIIRIPVQITFAAAGIGLIITGMVKQKDSIWHKSFHIILASMFFLSAVSLFRMNDFAGAGLFGMTAVFILLQLIIKIKSIVRYGIFVFLVVLTQPILLLFSYVPIGQFFLTHIFENKIIFIPFWIILVALSGAVFLSVKKNRSYLAWFILFFYGVLILIISIWEAQNLAWTKSLFLLLVSAFCIFTHWWTTLDFRTTLARIKALVALSVIGLTFIIIVVALYAIQQNTITLANQQLQDKVNYGGLIIDNTILSSEQLIEQTAQNSLVITTLQSKNITEEENKNLYDLLRTMLEANPSLRSLGILDKNGQRVVGYPHMEGVDGKNYHDRDYFQQAIRTKKLYITDVFTNSIDRPTVAISAPIITDDDKVVGVVVGALNFDHINQSLQAAATLQFDEYLYVTDKNKNYIIHPIADRIGKPAKDYAASPDIITGINPEGKRVLIAVSQSKERDWKTTAKIPLTTLLAPKIGETVLFYSIITFLLGVLLMIIISSIRNENIPNEDTS